MKNLDLFGVVSPGAVSLQKVREFLNTLDKNEPFTVYINSPGGSVYEGVAIYNLLAEHKPIVKIIGQASSIASVIAMAGGSVEIADNAVMLVHKPWTIAFGSEKDMQKTKDDLKVAENSIITTYKTKTGLSYKELNDLMNLEKVHPAKDLLKYNFVDKIYKPTKEQNETAQNVNNAYEIIMNLNKITNYKQNEEAEMADQKTVSELNADITILNSKIETLENVNQTHETEIQDLKAANAELINQNATLKTEKLTSDNDLKAANAKIQDLEKINVENEINTFMSANEKKILPKELESTKALLLNLKNSNPDLYKSQTELIAARDVIGIFDGNNPTEENAAPDNSTRKFSDLNPMNADEEALIVARVKEHMLKNNIQDFNTAHEQLKNLSN